MRPNGGCGKIGGLLWPEESNRVYGSSLEGKSKWIHEADESVTMYYFRRVGRTPRPAGSFGFTGQLLLNLPKVPFWQMGTVCFLARVDRLATDIMDSTRILCRSALASPRRAAYSKAALQYQVLLESPSKETVVVQGICQG